jgi:hypothetical protein
MGSETRFMLRYSWDVCEGVLKARISTRTSGIRTPSYITRFAREGVVIQGTVFWEAEYSRILLNPSHAPHCTGLPKSDDFWWWPWKSLKTGYG